MKQSEDKKTMELPQLPAPRKRGRPSTGKARTPSQRKAEQRAKASEIIWGGLDEEKRLKEIPESILIGLLSEKRHQANVIGQMIWEEIGRRNGYM